MIDFARAADLLKINGVAEVAALWNGWLDIEFVLSDLDEMRDWEELQAFIRRRLEGMMQEFAGRLGFDLDCDEKFCIMYRPLVIRRAA
ncbi:MAG: hypothetical protein Q7S80_00875 [bacterium]|nr:hypothetical protein [bacterium]